MPTWPWECCRLQGACCSSAEELCEPHIPQLALEALAQQDVLHRGTNPQQVVSQLLGWKDQGSSHMQRDMEACLALNGLVNKPPVVKENNGPHTVQHYFSPSFVVVELPLPLAGQSMAQVTSLHEVPVGNSWCSMSLGNNKENSR